MRLWICSCVFFCIALQSVTAKSEDKKYLVVYPSPPISQGYVYKEILQGIENKVGAIKTLEIEPGTINIQSQLDDAKPDKIIALADAAALVYKSTYSNKVIVGLVSPRDTKGSGVEMVIPWGFIASEVAQMIPAIKRVFVVQEPGQIIQNDHTHKNGDPELIFVEGDAFSTIRAFAKILENLANTDAAFIPQNLPDDILFKISLIAWERKVILFSTDLWHLEGAALMAFYPDPGAVGEQLGVMAKNNAEQVVAPKKINIAANLKIAQHHDISLSPSKLQKFSFVLK